MIGSDEKKFNLDGPDGYSYYWADSRKEPLYFRKRQEGGGSVMIWGAIGYYGRTNLVFLEGNINSEKYVQVL